MERVPRDVVLTLFHELINTINVRLQNPRGSKYKHVIPLGSTCRYLREIMLEIILKIPKFRSPYHFTSNLTKKIFKRNPYKVKILEDINLNIFKDKVKDILKVVKKCKGLEVLDLSMLEFRGGMREFVLVGLNNLRCVRVNARMDKEVFEIFLKNLPHHVTSLGLKQMTIDQFGKVAKYVNWMEEFGFDMYSFPIEGLRELLKDLVERNASLLRLKYLDCRLEKQFHWEAILVCYSLKELGFGFDKLNMTHLLDHSDVDTIIKVCKNFKNQISWNPLYTLKIPNVQNLIIKEFNITHLKIPFFHSDKIDIYFQPFQDHAKYQYLKSLQIKTHSTINPQIIYPHWIQLINVQKLTTTMQFLSDIGCYPPLPSVLYLSLDYAIGDLIFMDNLLKWIPQLQLLKLNLISDKIDIQKDLEKIKTWTIAPPDLVISSSQYFYSNAPLYEFQKQFSLSKVHLIRHSSIAEQHDPSLT